VSAAARESVPALLWRLWRDPAAWSTTVDIFAMLVAASLPWSTSLVAIFGAALLVSMAPFLDVRAFLQSLKRPICALPIALFVLAALGTLWSNALWGERLYAVGPASKLLILPVLLYHFERSARGVQVLAAFLVSCTLLMAMSWIVAIDPKLALKSGAEYGVPVKNYIDQSQEFAVCAVALAYPIRHAAAGGKNLAGGIARRAVPELRGQHGIRHGIADGAGHDADHAGGLRAASPEMAQHRHDSVRNRCTGRFGMGDIVAVALDR